VDHCNGVGCWFTVNRAKRYYVIYEDEQWKVKLEQGAVIKTFGSKYRQAIDYAKQLGRNNSRPVMVNEKSGATGAAYFSVSDLK